MLRHLRVTNFAILSDVAVDLGDGLNVLTGETGAGKSLIVEAVNLLRGGRASADIPRTGATEAIVEAIFEVPEDLRARVGAVLVETGCDADADEVLIRRVIQKGGRSRTYVNGVLTTATRLAELGALLVDLSGQHQHQGLVDPKRHREALDLFAEQPALGAEMTAAWEALRAIEEQLGELGGDESARAQRAEYLRFQVEELAGARLEPGEDERLELERARLAAVDQLQAGARLAEELLYAGEEAASDRLAAAAREVEKIARIDPELEVVARQIGEARVLVDDAAASLRHYADRLEGDPERLAWIDDRLALVRRLMRKHGSSSSLAGGSGGLTEVIARGEALRAELDALENRDERLAALEASRAKARERAEAAARSLTASRTRAARRLEREVGAALAELGMGSARLGVRIESRELGPWGADDVELMLASNKGEDARPLAKVASGGELSRIMLAMKLVLRRADEVATYVFDEVDTGVGGATATVVGRQIRGVADHRQVLCVTHLPQIAAFADVHFHVEKHEVDGRTETAVKKLNAAARKEELARMLGGTATARARAHAAEMLEEASSRAKGKRAEARA
jgi:DNA repair protein RecN (Recombination protein N)